MENVEATLAKGNQEKLHVCLVCSKSFKSPSLLNTHMRTHTKEKPFKCPYCSMASAQKSNLNKHIKTQHIKEASNEQIKVKEEVFTEEKPCKIENYAFEQKTPKEEEYINKQECELPEGTFFYRIFHQNINGVQSKSVRVNSELKKYGQPLDLLCFSEANMLSSDTPSLANYSLVSSFCRWNRKGGVCIFVKEPQEFKKIPGVEEQGIEFVFECTAVESVKYGINIVTIYRSPIEDKFVPQFFKSLQNLLTYICNISNSKRMVVCGDFNIDLHLHNDKSKKLIQIMKSFNLERSIFETTRYESGKCIDHIFHNISDSTGSVHNFGLSDHTAQILLCPVTPTYMHTYEPNQSEGIKVSKRKTEECYYEDLPNLQLMLHNLNLQLEKLTEIVPTAVGTIQSALNFLAQHGDNSRSTWNIPATTEETIKLNGLNSKPTSNETKTLLNTFIDAAKVPKVQINVEETGPPNINKLSTLTQNQSAENSGPLPQACSSMQVATAVGTIQSALNFLAQHGDNSRSTWNIPATTEETIKLNGLNSIPTSNETKTLLNTFIDAAKVPKVQINVEETGPPNINELSTLTQNQSAENSGPLPQAYSSMQVTTAGNVEAPVLCKETVVLTNSLSEKCISTMKQSKLPTPSQSGPSFVNDVLVERKEGIDEGWQIVRSKKKSNHFRSKNQFKAMDITTPLYITYVELTSDTKIMEYIQSKTKVAVSLHKINPKVPRQYDSYKMFVPNSEIALFLDGDFWPEGFRVRRFV